MNLHQSFESDIKNTTTSNIIKKNARLASSDKNILNETINRLPLEKFQDYTNKPLQAIIKTPDVSYEQRSILKVDSETPDLIVHELYWSEYKSQLAEKIYRDLKTTFLNLISDKTNKVITQIPIKYEELILSAINTGFSPLNAYRRTIETKQEIFLNLSFEGEERLGNPFPLFPKKGISDGVIAIRPTIQEHCDSFFTEQEDKVATYWSIFPARTYAEVKDYCQEARTNNFLGLGITASVIEESTQQVVGRVHLRPVVPPKVADVGYGIFPSHRGKGYAVKALNLFTDWIFSEAGYVRIELGIKEGNEASERVAQSCGYIRESSCPCRLKNQDGSFSTQISYAKISPFYGVKGE
ncbi:GNAT family N-acetyltransferase [Aeromonas hydrophila]|uniref:GNAT family N-acetyltransferase n=1 Tax=Aeromonas hydrophila TaxID=644 RepID=UPI002B4A0686|nr:GNAT family N-acetyltransferase [Aeromonas hydrophila]